jgi:hypothetical protein
MIQSFATVWYPSSNLYSPLVLVVTVVSVMACFVATRPRVRSAPLGEALMLFGAPILFVVVFFFAGGGPFPIRRGFPDASDMLATNIALGAGYLLAREATLLPTRGIRIAGWIEVIGFAMLATYEVFLHATEFFRR